MEREQIIKALGCISTKGDVRCARCDLRKYGGLACHRIGADNAISLIRELIEENERINLEYAGFEAGARHAVAFSKADTVRKMAERLKAETITIQDHTGKLGSVILASTIDQIAKEMLDGAESFGIMDGIKKRMEQDTCISCGMTIPEGRQICHSCEVREDD